MSARMPPEQQKDELRVCFEAGLPFNVNSFLFVTNCVGSV